MVWAQENENDDRHTLQRIAEDLHQGALASMIKTDIRIRYPEPYASCKANCSEEIFKQLR